MDRKWQYKILCDSIVGRFNESIRRYVRHETRKYYDKKKYNVMIRDFLIIVENEYDRKKVAEVYKYVFGILRKYKANPQHIIEEYASEREKKKFKECFNQTFEGIQEEVKMEEIFYGCIIIEAFVIDLFNRVKINEAESFYEDYKTQDFTKVINSWFPRLRDYGIPNIMGDIEIEFREDKTVEFYFEKIYNKVILEAI